MIKTYNAMSNIDSKVGMKAIAYATPISAIDPTLINRVESSGIKKDGPNNNIPSQLKNNPNAIIGNLLSTSPENQPTMGEDTV